MMNTISFRPLTAERTRLRVVGKDRKRFLHGMVSNDVQGLLPGQGCHAAMLTVKGKLVADLVLYDQGDEGILIETARGAGEKLMTTLDRYLIMDEATISDVSDEIAELGVYGTPAAAALASSDADPTLLLNLKPYHFLSTALEPSGSTAVPVMIAATPELGVTGFHVLGPKGRIDAVQERLIAAGAHPLSDAEQAALRIAAGTPLYGVDMTEDHMPAEAGLDDAVSHSKGCYLGQETVVRLRDRGHLNRRLVGLRITAGPGAALATGARLAHPSRPQAGVITSLARSPQHGLIALGYVHRSVWDAGTELQLVDADGAPTGATAVVSDLPLS
jgi:folate-binding protein YgfZ